MTTSRMSSTLVNAVTISSTNITGFLASVRGLSLTKAWPNAGTTIFGSSNVATGIRFSNFDVSIGVTPQESVNGACSHRELLDERPERERREEGETSYDQDD